MPTTALTPDQLDRQAARLHDTEAWQQIVTGWDITVPEPGRSASPGSVPHSADWRDLLSVPVDQLIADSVRSVPPDAPRERPSPGASARSSPIGSTAGAASGSPNCGPPPTSPTRGRS